MLLFLHKYKQSSHAGVMLKTLQRQVECGTVCDTEHPIGIDDVTF